MDTKAALQTALMVLKDWRVIVITIAVIFYLAFYSSIVSYRKKPKKAFVRKKRPARVAKPKANENDGEDTAEDNAKP
jgi:predicted membrane protein